MPSSQLDAPAGPRPDSAADNGPPRFPGIPTICATISESTLFNLTIAGLIVTNAVALGLSTYPSIDSVAGGTLAVLEWIFLTVFVGELIIRIVAHGHRPLDFFRNSWNVFDFVVIAAALLPGLHSSSTLLRLARIARIPRLVRFFPTLRAIIYGIGRSLPGIAGLLVLSVLVLYVYGMIGWLLFADDYPDDYGNIGRALLTLFVLLSLETLPDAIEAGRAIGDWTLLYFVSYVLIASYLLVNVLIGVIVNSMEEARQLRMTERLRPDYDADGDGVPDEIDRVVVAQRLDELREAVISLERELRIDRDQDQWPRTHSNDT